MAGRLCGVFLFPFTTNSVIKYIVNQEKHHKTKLFTEEYTEFMKKFEVEYDEKYLLD